MGGLVDGFFLAMQEFKSKVQRIIPQPHFFLKWWLGHKHQFHSLDQDQSTLAQQAELSVDEHCQHSQPTLTLLDHGCVHAQV